MTGVPAPWWGLGQCNRRGVYASVDSAGFDRGRQGATDPIHVGGLDDVEGNVAVGYRVRKCRKVGPRGNAVAGSVRDTSRSAAACQEYVKATQLRGVRR